jgi:hypothetical protein
MPVGYELDFNALPAANSSPAYKFTVVFGIAGHEDLEETCAVDGGGPENVARSFDFSDDLDWRMKRVGNKITYFACDNFRITKITVNGDGPKPTVRRIWPADADQAKAAATAFLMAVKAKDVDAVMKTTDVPFVFDCGQKEAQTFEKPDALKAALKMLIAEVDPKEARTTVGEVRDLAALAKEAKEQGGEKIYAAMEKLVGKTGYMVRVPSKDGKDSYGVLVRIKDGTALVVATTK